MNTDTEREAQIQQWATVRADDCGRVAALLVEAWAEIARLNEQVGYFMAEYQDEDGITELRAEIVRAYNNASRWQPIETAPKDGTFVLIVFSDGEVATARNQGAGSPEHNDWWSPDGLDFAYGADGPIGWLPREALPPPPASEPR